MNLKEAQAEVRFSYVGGGPGAIVSGLVWAVVAFLEPALGITSAFATLFFGGMLIYPVSALAARYVFKRPALSSDNGLNLIALESTIAMIGGFFAAFLFLRLEPNFVFPIAAIAVGTHYFAFRSLYGDALFWVLAALVTAIGFVGIIELFPLPLGTLWGVAIVEIAFGVLLVVRALRA